MRSDAAGAEFAHQQFHKALFPSLRVRGPLAIIGLSSARPTGLFLATGSLGQVQRDTLAGMLDACARHGLIRVLLVHHPPLAGTVSWRKRLTDSRSLEKLLRQHGVELLLHGHGHRALQDALHTRHGAAPVFGVPSASTVSTSAGRRAQYHLYRFTRDRDGWLVTVNVRGYVHDRDSFVSEGQRTLVLPRMR